MKEFTITKNDAGQRLDRWLGKAVPLLPAPLTKAELGGAVGRGSCAILALTDAGLANAAAQKLEGVDPQIRQHLEYKAEKTLRRRRETRRREKETQRGKPWAPPPADQ